MHRRRLLHAALLAGLARPAPQAHAAQGWPSRPLKLIVPFPAGGTSDLMARMVAAPLAQEIGQPVIAENVPGAGGVLGIVRALKAPPDGHTLVLCGVGSNAIAHGLDPNLPYGSLRDLAYLGLIQKGANVLLIHPQWPQRSLGELIDWVSAHPGKMDYGYTHAASGHMAMELLKQRGGPVTASGRMPLYIVGIPYRGAAPMLQDLLGGQFALSFVNQDLALPHVRSGRLRALAISSAQRNPLFPDLPTVAEAGLPGFEALSWSGLAAAAATPPAVLARLEAALTKVMATAAIRTHLEREGFIVAPPGAAFHTRYIGEQVALWSRVIKTAGIRPE